jgi:colicin import membrane protein
MREETWYKMLVVSALLHVFIIGAFSIPIKTSRKADLSYYSVNLVSDAAGGGAPKALPGEAAKPSPPAVQKKAEPKKPPQKEKPVAKERVVTRTKERSLAPKKKDMLAEPTKDEVRSLDQRIREMKSRARYMDVSGGKDAAPVKGPGLSGSSTDGSRTMDPILQKYYADVWERIQESWRSPSLSVSKGLLTIVSIKIRKDGRIADWTIEQRSGNRAYDESIARALRSIDTLPPFPSSLTTDYLEVGFNFHPPGVTR